VKEANYSTIVQKLGRREYWRGFTLIRQVGYKIKIYEWNFINEEFRDKVDKSYINQSHKLLLDQL
jgi:hypothetical protein